MTLVFPGEKLLNAVERANFQYIRSPYASERRTSSLNLHRPSLQEKPLSVFGEGKQTRSFCCVDDLVRGIVALLSANSNKTIEQRKDKKYLHTQDGPSDGPSIHDPVNIGNPRELTVIEIAKLVLKLTGSSSEIRFHPLPTDDPKVRRPDISRARALLKWDPQVSLEHALNRTIVYFRKTLSQ